MTNYSINQISITVGIIVLANIITMPPSDIIPIASLNRPVYNPSDYATSMTPPTVDRNKSIFTGEYPLEARKRTETLITARTSLGAQLMTLRKKIIESGAPLLSWDEIEREVMERRGEKV